MNTHMDNYRFDLATQSVYEFVWNDFVIGMRFSKIDLIQITLRKAK